jgi:hypothetical protein
MDYLVFDKRALALMRMCIASVILFDLAIRLTDLEAFYSNSGVVPLPLLEEYQWNPYFFSLHSISGLWQVQLLLFAFAFFCAILLFIGYRTQLFTFLSWIMLTSVHNRNGMILQGGDDLLRMILFWSIFIPWGARYACDSQLSIEKNPDNRLRSVACFAYLLQLCYLYTGSAMLKGPEWNSNFSALYYTYSLDQIAYPWTKYIYYHPNALRALTAIAWYFELLVPVLFFIPWKHAWFRAAGVLLIFIFHFLNGMTLFIGLFPAIGIATSVGMLPGKFIDVLEQYAVSIKTRARQSFLVYIRFVSKAIRWRMPYRLPKAARNVQTAFIIFLLVFVFDWNFSNLNFVSSKLSDNLRFIGYGLRLDQNWGMFAPGFYKDDGWYVFEAETESGTRFNLQDPGRSLSYVKPACVLDLFKNDRWRKYSENYLMPENEYARGYFCNYYKRRWNEDHPDEKIIALRVVYMLEPTLPDYKKTSAEKLVLWECLDE